MWAALVSCMKSDVGVFVGFAATVLGCLVGAYALLLTRRIYRWTSKADADRHAELLDAVRTMGETVRDIITGASVPPDLTTLSDAERSALQGLLQAREHILRVKRSGTGKGNHPWQAVTSAGRVLQVYTGGRRGGVHTSVLT